MRFTRRQFSCGTMTGLLGGAAVLSTPIPQLRAKEASGRRQGTIRITDIEVHEIMLPYYDWIADVLNHYYGPTRRTVYVVHTDKGLIGLGESGEREDTLGRVLGTGSVTRRHLVSAKRCMT